LSKGLAVYEFTRWLSTDVHAMGKLMFANGVPYRFAWLCPWLDVMGTETDWLSQGKYRPASDAQMCLWRTMAGPKPYLLLMNTDYQTFGPEMVERYFQRSLFYGMFPGMFSHNAADNPYWQNPKWYNRDRPLFKKYQPLIKRIAEAGWQPVTGARSDNPQIWVERFGPDAAGATYLTVLNDSSAVQKGTLRSGPKDLRVETASGATELLSGRLVGNVSGGWEVELAPQEAQVFRLMTRRPEREQSSPASWEKMSSVVCHQNLARVFASLVWPPFGGFIVPGEPVKHRQYCRCKNQSKHIVLSCEFELG